MARLGIAHEAEFLRSKHPRPRQYICAGFQSSSMSSGTIYTLHRRKPQKMAMEETFNFGPVPALPRANVLANYKELKSHPELYYEASSEGETAATSSCLPSSNSLIGRRHRVYAHSSCSCLLHDTWALSSLFGGGITANFNPHPSTASFDHYCCGWICGKGVLRYL